MEQHPLIDVIWIVLCAALVFLMQAGFMCLESGLTRSKNSINVAAKNITDLGVSVFLFWAFGFALMFGKSADGWIGSSYFFTPIGQGVAWLGAFFSFSGYVLRHGNDDLFGCCGRAHAFFRLRDRRYFPLEFHLSGVRALGLGRQPHRHARLVGKTRIHRFRRFDGGPFGRWLGRVGDGTDFGTA